jgi:hypothetical protein
MKNLGLNEKALYSTNNLSFINLYTAVSVRGTVSLQSEMQ